MPCHYLYAMSSPPSIRKHIHPIGGRPRTSCTCSIPVGFASIISCFWTVSGLRYVSLLSLMGFAVILNPMRSLLGIRKRRFVLGVCVDCDHPHCMWHGALGLIDPRPALVQPPSASGGAMCDREALKKLLLLTPGTSGRPPWVDVFCARLIFMTPRSLELLGRKTW